MAAKYYSVRGVRYKAEEYSEGLFGGSVFWYVYCEGSSIGKCKDSSDIIDLIKSHANCSRSDISIE